MTSIHVTGTGQGPQADSDQRLLHRVRPPLARCRPATRLSYSPLNNSTCAMTAVWPPYVDDRDHRVDRGEAANPSDDVADGIVAGLPGMPSNAFAAANGLRVALGGAGEAAEEHSPGHGDRSAQFGADRIGVANPEDPVYFPESCAVGIETPDERSAWERGRARG